MSTPGSAEDGRGPKKRSRNGGPASEIIVEANPLGCLTCRSRKVKCDEVQETCGQCTSLNLDCAWQDGMEAGPSKKIRAKPKNSACWPCRQAKARCDRDTAEDTCERCKSSGLSCSNAVPPTPAKELEAAESIIRFKAPSPTTLLDIIDVYFSQVQPSEGIEFIHRGDFMREFVDGNVPALLLQSILLVSGRFLPSANADNVDGGPDLAKLAVDLKMGIMADTDRFSVVKLGVLLNIRIHEQNAGRHGSVWLLVSLITRMAYALGLNTERIDMSTIESESRRRMMWASHSADSQAAGGIHEYTLTDRRTLGIVLPVSERAFALGMPVRGRTIEQVELNPNPGQENEDGIASRHVRMISLRNDILSYTKYIQDFAPLAWEPTSRFETICQKLRCWQTSLAADLQLNLESLYALKGQPGMLGSLACLHIWFDQLHSTLYRLAFPGFDESAPAEYLAQAPIEWVDKLRRGCYHRAIEVRQKIRFLAKHSLYLKTAGFRVSGFVFECIRNQLAYIRYAFPDGEPPEEHAETLRGFEDVISFVVRCSISTTTIRAPLRRILALTERHGYVLNRHYAVSGSETRPASPGQGPVLAKLPYLQTILRHPNAEHRLSPRRLEDAPQGVDPVTEGPLSHSPATSASRLQYTSPPQADALYNDPFNLLNDLFHTQNTTMDDRIDQVDPFMSLWGENENDSIVGTGMDPWFSSDIDIWTAQVPNDRNELFMAAQPPEGDGELYIPPLV